MNDAAGAAAGRAEAFATSPDGISAVRAEIPGGSGSWGSSGDSMSLGYVLKGGTPKVSSIHPHVKETCSAAGFVVVGFVERASRLCSFNLLPGSSTWKLGREFPKTRLLYQRVVFGFHLNLQESISTWSTLGRLAQCQHKRRRSGNQLAPKSSIPSWKGSYWCDVYPLWTV